MSTVMGSSACATRGTSVLTMLDFVLIVFPSVSSFTPPGDSRREEPTPRPSDCAHVEVSYG
jgi:hypothetical protein